MSISPRNPDASAARGRVRLGRVAHVGGCAASPILLEEALEAYLDLRLLPVSQDAETGPSSVRESVPESDQDSLPESVRVEPIDKLRVNLLAKRESRDTLERALAKLSLDKLETNGVGELETNGGGAGRPVRFNLKGEIL